MTAVSGSFSGVGQSASIKIRGMANVSLFFGGAVATVALERSFDDGATWFVVSKNSVPEDASYTDNVDAVIEESEPNVLYRWNCTAFTSGGITYRISQGYAPKARLL